MGASQSRTRKLTVENDDPTSVIKVSDDVVQRIKNNQEVKDLPQEPSGPQTPVAQQPLIPQSAFVYEPSVTTVQLRQANVAELKKNDRYWENRLRTQEANHKHINDILEEEYKKAIKEMEVTETTKTPSSNLPPCQEAKESVLRCYRENASQPINCVKVVQDFQQCVDKKRASLIANRG